MNGIDFINAVDFLYLIIFPSVFGIITGQCLCLLYEKEMDKVEIFLGDLWKGFKLQFTRRK